MATTYSNEATNYLNTSPPTFASGNTVGGRLRRYRATIDLASQASGSDIVLNQVPNGSVFAFGMMTASASLGTATVAIGVTGATGSLRAAATFTTANAPTLFGIETAVGGAAVSSDTTYRITTGTAALPASGQLIIDLYFSQV